jgi:glycosyltransferase involved in cell wall biosynthesis
MSGDPYFSIVIPVYNRSHLIRRALDSCLGQQFEAFEVVVVDDGSTDDTPAVVQSYANHEVHLVVHEQNRGQCPARNTGARAARGEWLVFLDSDDELMPGALNALQQWTTSSGGFDKLYAMVQLRDGSLSPDPPLDGSIWDYPAFLKWLERSVGRRSEALPCTRRTAFLNVPYPESRAYEGIHNLDFVARYSMLACPAVVRVYHQDAPNRLMLPDTRLLMKGAADYAEEAAQVLDRHGDALSKWAPSIYLEYLRAGAIYHFLLGERRAGARLAMRYLRSRPRSLRGWAVLFAGLGGRRPIALLRSLAARRRGTH